jgi:hypothetical protein
MVWGRTTGFSTFAVMEDTTAVPVDAGEAAEAFPQLTLSQNYPNPFTPSTAIRFLTRNSGRISIRIYDVAGRLVRTLVDEERAAGAHELIWDGRDNGSRMVAGGVYWCRAKSASETVTRRMVRLR